MPRRRRVSRPSEHMARDDRERRGGPRRLFHQFASGDFLRHLNMTPGRYYMRLRLERARELLRQTNMPILDIAIATGFTSHSYFAQSYRLQFGRPPSEERRTTY